MADITVEYGDVETSPPCFNWGLQDPTTFTFTVNGVDRSGYFSVGDNQAVGTNVPLVDDADNVFVASMLGNDVNGNPRTDSDTKTTYVDWTPAPTVNATPYNPDAQDFGRCAVSCFAATYAQSTVPYFSLDTPRNVTLVYNGARVAPRPFIHVDVTHPAGSSNVPQEFWLEAKVNGTLVTFLNGETRLHFSGSSQTVRLGGQFDASSYATNVYPLDIIVTSLYANPTKTAQTVVSTRLAVVNETSSPIARGWTVGGVQRLYLQASGAALITEGGGSAVYFDKPCPSCSFVTPLGELSSLTTAGSGGSTTYTRIYRDSTRVTFDNAGRMVRVTDRFGSADSILYDGSGRVWKLRDPTHTDAAPREIVLAYGSNGLSSITDPFGRVTGVTVQANGMLTSITDPDNVATSFGYDGSLRLSTITDRRGFATTVGYDAQSGTLASVTAPAVPIYGQGTVAPVTSLATWQKLGVPYGSTSTPVTPPRADTVRGTVTDPAGHAIRFTVNGFGQALVTTDPLGNATTVTYNGNGQALTVSDPLGVNSSFSYDTEGFMTSSTVGGLTTNFRKGGWFQADSIWGAGVAQRIFIGPYGRVDSVRVGGTSMTKFLLYDSRGRPGRLHDGQHSLREIWYGGVNGNTSKDSLPGGTTLRYGYDSFGRLTTVTQAGLATRTTEYDPVNRPTRIFDGVNPSPTVIAYDSLLVRSVTDPRGQVYGFAYNALGWPTSRTDPVGRSEAYQYDRDGALVRWTNRRGQSVDYVYDALHRLRRKSGVNTTTDSIGYSTDGHVITATNAVTTEITYLNTRLDPDSVRTDLGGQTFWQRFLYTAQGLLDSAWTTGGGITFLGRRYFYTPSRGTLDVIRLGGAATTFGYTLVDLRTPVPNVSLGSTGTVTRDGDTRHRRIKIASAAPFGPTIERTLGYDRTGRLARQTLSDGTSGHSFSYDQLGRLAADTTFWSGPISCTPDPDVGYLCPPGPERQTSTTSYAYDEVGNRLDLGGSYSTGNRITGFNGCSYATDYDGNVTSRTCSGQTVSFSWSAENRLTGVSITGASSLAFQYDAAGRVVRKDVGGAVSRYFLWQGANLLAELGAGATSKLAEYSYYNGLDRPHAVVVDGQTHYAHVDGQGNVIALNGNGGEVTRTYEYEPWGQLIGGSDNAALADRDRARWKGALWMGPEVELYYMRNRWYEPATGRFLSEDPIRVAGGLNFYVFGAANPIGRRDPNGLDPDSGRGGRDFDPRNLCPAGGMKDIDTGLCRLDDGTYYDPDALKRAWAFFRNFGFDVEIVSSYSHLSQIMVRVGQAVHTGDVIGLSGSTGASSGPHVHFELLVGGVASLDPLGDLGHWGWGSPVGSGILDVYSDVGVRYCRFHGLEFHRGVDIDIEAGVPVTAVAAGIVIWAAPNGGYGNQVRIRH
jgi:RHS repeat-associated protein